MKYFTLWYDPYNMWMFTYIKMWQTWHVASGLFIVKQAGDLRSALAGNTTPLNPVWYVDMTGPTVQD